MVGSNLSTFTLFQIMGFLYMAFGLALSFAGLKYKVVLSALSTSLLITHNSIYYLGLTSWTAIITAIVIFIAINIVVILTREKKSHILCLAYICGYSIGAIVWTFVASYYSGEYVRIGFEITFGLYSVRLMYKNSPKDLLGLIVYAGANMIANGIFLLSGGFGNWASFGV